MAEENIRLEALQMPSHLSKIKNEFRFDYSMCDNASIKAENRSLRSNINDLIEYIMESNLPEEEKLEVVDLLHEEKEVIQYAESSAVSIFHL